MRRSLEETGSFQSSLILEVHESMGRTKGRSNGDQIAQPKTSMAWRRGFRGFGDFPPLLFRMKSRGNLYPPKEKRFMNRSSKSGIVGLAAAWLVAAACSALADILPEGAPDQQAEMEILKNPLPPGGPMGSSGDKRSPLKKTMMFKKTGRPACGSTGCDSSNGLAVRKGEYTLPHEERLKNAGEFYAQEFRGRELV